MIYIVCNEELLFSANDWEQARKLIHENGYRTIGTFNLNSDVMVVVRR